MFLTRYLGGGIESVLDLYEDDFFIYFNAASELYKAESERAVRVVLAGLERK